MALHENILHGAINIKAAATSKERRLRKQALHFFRNSGNLCVKLSTAFLELLDGLTRARQTPGGGTAALQSLYITLVHFFKELSILVQVLHLVLKARTLRGPSSNLRLNLFSLVLHRCLWALGVYATNTTTLQRHVAHRLLPLHDDPAYPTAASPRRVSAAPPELTDIVRLPYVYKLCVGTPAASPASIPDRGNRQ